MPMRRRRPHRAGDACHRQECTNAHQISNPRMPKTDAAGTDASQFRLYRGRSSGTVRETSPDWLDAMTTPVPEATPDTPAEAPRAGTGEWHFAPDLPIGNNPLFAWPLRIRDIVAYHRDYWFTLSEAVIFLALAVAGWWSLRSILGDMSVVLAPGWIGAVLALNFGLVLLFAGGFHLFFYSFRKQGDERKYVAQFGHRGGSRFTFSPILSASAIRVTWCLRRDHDNMFWSLASGVPIWSGYVVLILWTHANGWTPAVTMADNPVLFILILMFTGPWVAFHFYWGTGFSIPGPSTVMSIRCITATSMSAPGPAFRCILLNM